MKKIALLLPLLVAACGDTNKAEVMIKAQADKATCTNYASASKSKPDITLCDIKVEKDTYTWVGVYGAGKPFRTFLVLTAEQEAKAEEARKKAEADKSAPASSGPVATPPAFTAPPPATPDAGSK